MAEDDKDDSQKTEEPTGKRLSDAREKGNVAISTEVKMWIGMVGTVIFVGFLAEFVSKQLLPVIRHFLENFHGISVDYGNLGKNVLSLAADIGIILAFPLGIILVMGVLGTIIQIGFMVTPSKIAPKFSKLNPFNGLKSMLSPQQLIELPKGLLKIILVGVLFWLILSPKVRMVEHLPGMELAVILEIIRDLTLALAWSVLLFYTFVAGGDFIYRKWKYKHDLRMTRQEVKEEMKNQEGDPLIKGKLRQKRMEKGRQRIMLAVPQATVVITNPTHFAVALKYDMDTMPAPLLVAKGVDILAAKIREVAKENEVPIVENPPLARALYATVEIDQEIPPEHYKAVAEVIGYVMKIKRQLPQENAAR